MASASVPPTSGGASNPSPNVRTGRKKKMAKNAAGNKTDLAWSYGVAVDGNNRKIQCKFCQKVIHGSIYRMKHHLARTSKDVGACTAVSDEVQQQMLKIVSALQENLIKKTSIDEVEEAEDPKVAGKRVVTEAAASGGGSTTSTLFKRRCLKQTSINSHFKKSLKDDAHLAIARFFYNNAIPFNVARSEEYKAMFDLVAKHGQGFQPPSYYDLRVKLLKKQVKLTNDYLEEHKDEWKRVGCSIMTDGWTDKRRRTIMNFLVNSPKGTVFMKSIDASDVSKTGEVIFKMIDEIVEEVGEENVVQLVTDNAANCVLAGELLMAKRKHLYWTPCAAHCLDLLLEDLMSIPYHAETIPKGKKITSFIYGRTSLISLMKRFTNNRDLVRPGATRFATSYLTLICLHENKDNLIRMFTSKEWKSNRCAKLRDGPIVEDIVLDKEFWKNVVKCMKGALPLVKVLRLVDSDKKQAMGFIYEAMDQAKEEIQQAFNGIKKSYNPYWTLIDKRWNKMLHRPLHAAAYYLNPQMHYSPKFKADAEVKRGFMDALDRLVADPIERSLIHVQKAAFRKRTGYFGCEMARLTQNKQDPADWWESYGIDCPELQQFAIRVLSLTASSSGCERNWSAFDLVHTKRRNRLKAKTMNDVVFVMVNSRLAKNKKQRKAREYDDLESDSEWVAGDEDEGTGTQDNETIHVDDDVDDEDSEATEDDGPILDGLDQTPTFGYAPEGPEHDGDGGEEEEGDGGEEEDGDEEEDQDGGEDDDGGEDGDDGGEDDFEVNMADYV